MQNHSKPWKQTRKNKNVQNKKEKNKRLKSFLFKDNVTVFARSPRARLIQDKGGHEHGGPAEAASLESFCFFFFWGGGVGGRSYSIWWGGGVVFFLRIFFESFGWRCFCPAFVLVFLKWYQFYFLREFFWAQVVLLIVFWSEQEQFELCFSGFCFCRLLLLVNFICSTI